MSDSTEATNNIYLIADDYVDVTKLPRGTDTSGNSVGNPPANTNTNYPKAAIFDNIMSYISLPYTSFIAFKSILEFIIFLLRIIVF